MPAEYDGDFYVTLREGARKSAAVIVPLVLQYVQPRSIVDVGCGTGTWLSVFNRCGITDTLGVDGDYVRKQPLEIPEDRFLAFDLTTPLQLDRQFDLVVSLEVAEHLPPECAELFVRTLVGLGPAILFSAAIPLQGGTHHVNEQWPDYWAALFSRMGYVPVDAIRRRVWQDPDLDFWYAQNILIYVRRESLGHYPALQRELERSNAAAVSVVHPRMHLAMARRITEANQERTAVLAENERFRAEAETSRARAESLAAKAEGLTAEYERLTAEHERLTAEHERLTAEHERRREEAKPENMGLRRLVRALPGVGWNALKRRGRKWLVRR